MENKLILPESWWPQGVSYRMPWAYSSRGPSRFMPQLRLEISEVNSQMLDSLLMTVHQTTTQRVCPASLLEEAELKDTLWVWLVGTDSQWVRGAPGSHQSSPRTSPVTHLAGKCWLGRLLLPGHMNCCAPRQPREMEGARQQISLDLGCKERTSWKVTP